MTGLVTSFGRTLSGEHVSRGKSLQFCATCNEGYCLTMSTHTSRGCNSQTSFGTLATKVFSTSLQILFSITKGQEGVSLNICSILRRNR